jgi:hypothetical protein
MTSMTFKQAVLVAAAVEGVVIAAVVLWILLR